MSVEDHPKTAEPRKGAHFRRRSWLAIGAGFVLLVLAALCAVAVAIAEDQISHAGRESRAVRDAQNEVFKAIEDAETGQRGYLLTNDATYLQPFLAAKSRLPTLEAKLEGLASSDSTKTHRVSIIKTLVDQKLAELSQTVELHRAGDPDRALTVVKSNLGRDLMARIREESGAFDRVEARLADQRRVNLSQKREGLIWIVVAALVIAIGLAAFVALEIRLYASELDARYVALNKERTDRRRAEAQLRQSQKMDALGQLTGGVAHDFNNMLAIVVGNLDMLLRRMTDQDDRIRSLAENALSGANKAAALTKSLLAFSRLQPLQPQSTNVNKCVSALSEMLRRTLGEHIAVETVLSGGVWRAYVDCPQLESAILNLAINARDAMPSGGKLTIETSNASLDRNYADEHDDVEPGQYVLVAVTDTGGGMTPEVLEKAFDPFFTTKPVGEGTGLGLSQVHGFLKQSRGHIKIYSELGIGTTIKLYLPRDHSAEAVADVPALTKAKSDNSKFTVLVVEDDPGVRSFATSAVRELGYKVEEADSANVALERLGRDPSISILLTDVVMPGLTGRQLVDLALDQRADLPVVYMTGYTRNAIVHNGALDPGTRLLTKPFTLSELDRELHEALSAATVT